MVYMKAVEQVEFQRICDDVISGEITEFNFVDKISVDLFRRHGDKILNIFEFERMRKDKTVLVSVSTIELMENTITHLDEKCRKLECELTALAITDLFDDINQRGN